MLEYIEIALTIIGALAAIVKGFEVIAGITPTTKDDELVGKVSRWLGVLVYWLDTLSLGLKKNNARRD